MKKLTLRAIGLKPDPRLVAYYFPEGTYRRIDTPRTVTLVGPGKINLQWRADVEGIGPGLLSIISRVKKELRDREKLILWPAPSEYKVPYCALKEWDGVQRVFELDLTAAYVSAAYKMKALSKETRDLLLSCHKRTRLIALGATATRKTVTEFVAGKQTSSAFVQDPLGRRFFEALSVRVSGLMDQLRRAAGSSFAYYWADAIFVQDEEGCQRVQARARELGAKLHPPAPHDASIASGLLTLDDARTFPARTLRHNPFDTMERVDRRGPGAEKSLGLDLATFQAAKKEQAEGKRIPIEQAIRELPDRAPKKYRLESREDLKALWDASRINRQIQGKKG